ncbi:MAG: hypothetical protein KatS3mg126_0298 [Lysobacteraceae bacterium]|nr:MAG: hypothetical protein KatS3mg126_0298 [Xanthomonadaceae bacterium]
MTGTTAPRPVVVVPVYNAAAALRDCLAALEQTLGPQDRVLLADDASTDPEVPRLCAAYAARSRAEVRYVRRARNLGFVGNVNLAFAETAGDDVVLLNSDTLPTPGWLARMAEAAARAPDAATLTPWSNHAEICSFPEFCKPAPVPDADARLRLARAAASLDELPLPELPTGVGFAMFVRRRALEQLGDFDAATFGRGYGEENDFCLRAAAHGWRNLFCPTAYVAHLGGASFAATGHAPGGENLRRLLIRYPDYNARVAAFILADPLRPYRERLAKALAALESP